MDAPIIRSVNNNPVVQKVAANESEFPTGYPPNFSNDPNVGRVQNILISANTAAGTLHVTDDGAAGDTGNLIGDVQAGGTINYLTGVVSGLNFTVGSVIPSGTDIKISYNPTNQAIPQAILFWQNNITLRPTPDEGYMVEIVAYRRPSQALLGTGSSTNMAGVPEQWEWWETLAAGAAKKIYEDRQDMEGVQMMDKMLFERYDLNETRTYAQMGKRRIETITSEQLQGFGGGYFGWGGNSG